MQDTDGHGFGEADMPPEKRLSRLPRIAVRGLRGRANPMPETAIAYTPGACRS